MASTAREQAKAHRFEALLREAARLFAARGFAAVTLEEIGGAVGVSGPAIYRHVAGKQGLLGAVLLRVSEDLLGGGAEVCATHREPLDRMRALVAFQVSFALNEPDVIKVHDRELPHLAEDDAAEVRRLQREYVGLWIDTLGSLCEGTPEQLRLRVQACFGLINSTPHSTRKEDRTAPHTAELLEAMALAALLIPLPERAPVSA